MKFFLLVPFIFPAVLSRAQDYKSFPMWNAALPMEQRVNDVVNRLTLEEKVAQMMHAAPAVPRLGIPAYNWWNEVLHGVGRTPYNVTSYPQAIGMAATWDTGSLKRMADYSATEGRAIHNKAAASGHSGDPYVGLTYWTPNINIFRDPRWGRGQETYGEDPFLTAKLASAFVSGLQGDDPKYLKAAACAKHFAVHSGPEPTRHAVNVEPSTYDLWDTYLPAFRELVVNAKVAGVMCAYNAIYTQPCCANDLLMNDILRNQWKFTGYVTSDCWAIDDFFTFHKTHKDAEAAGIDALIHGTDVECGNSVYGTLVNAVKTGQIKESQIDISLKRLFMIRYRLGMFDPPSMVKYARVTDSELESPAHKAHALKMAQQAIVLLRNENNLLPLSKNLKKIAVVGPNADDKMVILGNYNGVPSHVTTILDGIRAKLGAGTEVIYEKGINYANDTLMVYENTGRLFSIDGKPGVKAEYFTNEKLEGVPAYTTTEGAINHFWSEGQNAAPGIGNTHYSARYTTWLRSEKDEVMNFEIDGDDGYRIFVDGGLRIDEWPHNRVGAKQISLSLERGKSYKIVVEFTQTDGPASIRFRPCRQVKTDMNALSQRLKDVDAIIFVGGISPQLEGEEMPVAIPGFKGGDRTSILLPAIQTSFMKSLKATGKPVVFVMMTGSALAVNWESENIPAIVNTWYGGQSAGTALADVIFGDYNPAGRLPVTFYKSDSDLPEFSNYDMSNRTYRYFKGEALYPFGYGLSYSTFKYSNLSIPATTSAGKSLMVTAKVTNTGKRDGEEVVELYLAHPGATVKSPIRALKGFQRIALRAGETRTIRFNLQPSDLSLVDEQGKLTETKGKLMISVGGGQPGVKNKTTSNVLTRVITVN